MDEEFLININCGKILPGCPETQYTMLIDTSKISIVYELVEWIRWIFSVDTCIYLAHEDSVIHELEDIRVLSKINDLVIKPCGRLQCAHKKLYRTLLDKLNLFVTQNEMKVHKYFIEKINQIGQKLHQEGIRSNNNLDITGAEAYQSFMKNENIETSNSKIISRKNKSLTCDNPLPECNVEGTVPNKKSGLIDKSELGIIMAGKSPAEINYFNKKVNLEKSLSNDLEGNTDYCGSSSNLMRKNGELNINYGNSSQLKDCEMKNFKTRDTNFKMRIKSNSHKSSHKFVRPFSIGEMLSSIREDFKKQNTEDSNKKINSIASTKEGDFDEITATENLYATETKSFGRKKRRIRKRKKAHVEIENENLVSPLLESNSSIKNFHTFNSSPILKPSHIRFDLYDEGNLMETDPLEDELKVKNETENECGGHIEINESNTKSSESDTTFLKPEIPKLSVVSSEYSLTILNLPEMSTPVKSPTESKMGSQEVNNQIGNDEKVTDLCSEVFQNDDNDFGNADEKIKLKSFHQNFNLIQALKEKCGSPFVIQRFY